MNQENEVAHWSEPQETLDFEKNITVPEVTVCFPSLASLVANGRGGGSSILSNCLVFYVQASKTLNLTPVYKLILSQLLDH